MYSLHIHAFIKTCATNTLNYLPLNLDRKLVVISNPNPYETFFFENPLDDNAFFVTSKYILVNPKGETLLYKLLKMPIRFNGSQLWHASKLSKS